MSGIYRESDGSYPAYAWPGGYPVYYIMDDGGVLCADCTNKNRELDQGPQYQDGWHVVGQDINWEDASLYCDHCNERIESAYAEDEAEK